MAKNLLRVVVGTKRTGKTTLARRLLRSLSRRRIAVFDPTAEDYPEFPIVSRREFATTLALNKSSGDFEVRFVPEDEEDIIFFANCVRAIDNVDYVIDESGSVLEARTKEKAIYSLVTMGGHWTQNGIYVTQMPTTLPRVVRSQADVIDFFLMDEVNDLDWSENYLKSQVEQLETLEKFHYLEFIRGRRDVEEKTVEPFAISA